MLLWHLLAFGYGVCVVVFVHALKNAPVGYEDENGFHLGPEPLRDEYIDRPLIQPAGWRDEHSVPVSNRGTAKD